MGTLTVDPRLDEAGRILAEYGDERNWPKGREAVSALTWARESLAEALDTYTRFRGRHLPPFPGDVEEALDAAADIAEDEGRAFRKVHARYVRREAREQVAS